MNTLLSRRSTLLLSAAALLSSSSLVQAQRSTWTIDKSHSSVEFQIRHLGVSTVRGSLSGIVGTVQLDEKNITDSAVEARIDANTINTNDSSRDAHLKSADFFNVAKYPSLFFKSTGLKRENGKLEMTGDLTLGGQTKPVTLEVDGPAPPQKGMNGKMVSGFSATGVLSRKDFNFGQKYGEPLLGDQIKFTIDLEIDH